MWKCFVVREVFVSAVAGIVGGDNKCRGGGEAAALGCSGGNGDRKVGSRKGGGSISNGGGQPQQLTAMAATVVARDDGKRSVYTAVFPAATVLLQRCDEQHSTCNISIARIPDGYPPSLGGHLCTDTQQLTPPCVTERASKTVTAETVRVEAF